MVDDVSVERAPLGDESTLEGGFVSVELLVGLTVMTVTPVLVFGDEVFEAPVASRVVNNERSDDWNATVMACAHMGIPPVTLELVRAVFFSRARTVVGGLESGYELPHPAKRVDVDGPPMNVVYSVVYENPLREMFWLVERVSGGNENGAFTLDSRLP